MKMNIADYANLLLLDRVPPALRAKLECATLVPTDEVPPDVVTMHSRVRLADASSGRCEDVTLVYPPESGGAAARISVLDGLGIALLGATVGETIQYRGEEGVSYLEIQAILYQPEDWMRVNFVVRE